MKALSQRDPRWQNIILGHHATNGDKDLTIGQAGCLITAVASALSDLVGWDTSPASINDYLKQNGGYVSDNLMVFDAFAPLGLRLTGFIDCTQTPYSAAAVTELVQRGFGVLAMVDSIPGGAVQMHWVRVTGQDAEGKLLIMDPWQLPGKELTTLDLYGGKVLKLATYRSVLAETRTGRCNQRQQEIYKRPL